MGLLAENLFLGRGLLYPQLIGSYQLAHRAEVSLEPDLHVLTVAEQEFVILVCQEAYFFSLTLAYQGHVAQKSQLTHGVADAAQTFHSHRVGNVLVAGRIPVGLDEFFNHHVVLMLTTGRKITLPSLRADLSTGRTASRKPSRFAAFAASAGPSRPTPQLFGASLPRAAAGFLAGVLGRDMRLDQELAKLL